MNSLIKDIAKIKKEDGSDAALFYAIGWVGQDCKEGRNVNYSSKELLEILSIIQK